MPITIHHSTIKSAEKQGIMLEVDGMLVRAFIPANAILAFGVSGADAVKQVLAAKEIWTETEGTIKFRHGDDHKTVGNLWEGDDVFTTDVSTPVALLDLFKDNKLTWKDTRDAGEKDIQSTDEQPASDPTGAASPVDGGGQNFVEDEYPKETPVDARPPVKRAENGVALDGRTAYLEGTPAGDNPYNSETEDEEEYALFTAWDEAWDAAADEKAEEDADEKGGSVVASKYRTKYKEEGHPNHCGDWLADLLNNYCIGDKNTDLEMAERIFGMNGVDTSKYRREGIGWQGRIRMTGRNLLAKKVFQSGRITVPNPHGGDVQTEMTIAAPADWMSSQRYSKPDAK